MAQDVRTSPALEPAGFKIAGAGQARQAGAAAERLATQVGFATREAQEIALAVVELGTNLVRHAGGGELELRRLEDAGGRGIEVVAQDSGPGIVDVERALTDGFSTAGGLGQGLGTVNRLMDRLELSPRLPAGLRICCQRWVRPTPAPAAALKFGGASRACRYLAQNGDSMVVCQWSGHALAGVIDGLGHGPLAQRAAQAARDYVENHFDRPFEELFRGAGRACRATRGVVMALARFDLDRHKVVIAGIGNVGVRLLGGARPFRPVVRRGIVGQSAAPEPLTVEAPWTAASALVMHSDGVEPLWAQEPMKEWLASPPALQAQGLLARYGRLDDDATVLVVREAAPEVSNLACPR
jgi:anti-sigma regulatory factor (Ser/Thr protein kinase)